MTYISGQPIVFVGTGQTYTDLKSLNAKVNFIQIIDKLNNNILTTLTKSKAKFLQAVVTALMK